MSVVLDEQTDTVVLEGLDFEVPCQSGEHAAHLSVSCRTCPEHAFWCSDHWGAKRRRIEEYLAGNILAVVVCSACKTQAYTIEDLVDVVPL